MRCSVSSRIQTLLLLSVVIVFQYSTQFELHRHHKRLCKRHVSGHAGCHKRKVSVVVTIKSSGQDPSQDEPQKTTPMGPTTDRQETTTQTLVCFNPGTFPNPNNCTDFFICQKLGNTSELEKVDMSCPKGMAFDRKENKCFPDACSQNDDDT
ncbi:hypothetical protein JTB14_012271 [Gonioctena quinquepunctata]|nr:hypothetical protein JTB14_012271 [Gonioctena quinquepunctata]